MMAPGPTSATVARTARSAASGLGAPPGPFGPAAVAVRSVGGSPLVGLAAVLAFFVALALAVLVTARFVRGYRRTGRRPLLGLAVGLFLLAPAPMFLRLLLGNVETAIGVGPLLVSASKLCGLLVILRVVYDG